MKIKNELLTFASGICPKVPKACIFELVNGEPTLTHVYKQDSDSFFQWILCVIDSDHRDQSQIFLKAGVEKLGKIAGFDSGKIEFVYSVDEAKEFIEVLNSLGGTPFILGENLLS